MELRRLGRTALRVSELCLGTMNFGPLTTEDDVVRDHGPRARPRHQLLRHRQPLRRRQGPGHDRDDRRATGSRRAAAGARRWCSRPRCSGRCPSGPTTAGSRRATSATRAKRACAACRPITSTSTRCTTSTGPRRGTRSGRRWRRSSTQGKVIYVGSSNFAGWHIAQANEAAAAAQLPRPRQRAEPLQPRVAHRRARGAARVPRRTASAVIPWSPLAGGMLGGMLGPGDTAPAQEPEPALRSDRARSSRSGRSSAPSSARSRPRSRSRGCCSRSGVTAPIIGPRTLEQLEGASLRATEITLDDDSLKAIDEIFPGPGGKAPEAYAW